MQEQLGGEVEVASFRLSKVTEMIEIELDRIQGVCTEVIQGTFLSLDNSWLSISQSIDIEINRSVSISGVLDRGSRCSKEQMPPIQKATTERS